MICLGPASRGFGAQPQGKQGYGFSELRGTQGTLSRAVRGPSFPGHKGKIVGLRILRNRPAELRDATTSCVAVLQSGRPGSKRPPSTALPLEAGRQHWIISCELCRSQHGTALSPRAGGLLRLLQDGGALSSPALRAPGKAPPDDQGTSNLLGSLRDNEPARVCICLLGVFGRCFPGCFRVKQELLAGGSVLEHIAYCLLGAFLCLGPVSWFAEPETKHHTAV